MCVVQNISYNFVEDDCDAYYFHGCETWSLTSRKEHGLSVFENRVLRKIYRA